jgi:hypothetical protein
VDDLKLLKCPACGSSKIIKFKDNICNCEHCGSSLLLRNQSLTTINKKSNNAPKQLVNLIVGLIIFSGIIIFFGLLYFLFSAGYKFLHSDVKPEATNSSVIVNNSNQALKPNKQIDLSPRIEVNNQVQGTTNNGSLFWIVELKNNGTTMVRDISVVISLFDEIGQRIEEKKGWPLVKFLSPQQATEAVLSVKKPIKGYSRIEIHAHAKKAFASDVSQVLIDVEKFIVNQQKNQFEIIGEFSNLSNFNLINVNVIAVGLDLNGVPVAYGYKYASRIELARQELTGFKVNVYSYIAKQPIKWKVIAVANKSNA